MIPMMANQMEKNMGKKWKLASDDLGFFGDSVKRVIMDI